MGKKLNYGAKWVATVVESGREKNNSEYFARAEEKLLLFFICERYTFFLFMHKMLRQFWLMLPCHRCRLLCIKISFFSLFFIFEILFISSIGWVTLRQNVYKKSKAFQCCPTIINTTHFYKRVKWLWIEIWQKNCVILNVL